MKERAYNLESPFLRGASASAAATAAARADAPSSAVHRAAGLSKLHTVTEPPPPVVLTYYEGASLVDIQGPRRTAIGSDRPSMKRGEILEWSAASRGKLKQTLGKALREELAKGLINTLTYPKEFPSMEEFHIFKGHLRVFCQALQRRYPGASGVWKQEFQRRDAVHFHIILLSLSHVPLEELRAWITAKWYKIAHNGDVHEGKACCQVDPIKSKGGVMSYMAKYLSKDDQTRPGYRVGRYWGTFGGKSLPFGVLKSLEVTPAQITRVRRIGRRKIEADVNQSRWNKFLAKDGCSMRKPSMNYNCPYRADAPRARNAWALGNRNFWQQAKSCHHGGARNIYFQHLQTGARHPDDSELRGVEGWRDGWTSTTVVEMYRPPGKWKAKCNDRVRVFCDADAFIACLQRALAAGIL